MVTGGTEWWLCHIYRILVERKNRVHSSQHFHWGWGVIHISWSTCLLAESHMGMVGGVGGWGGGVIPISWPICLLAESPNCIDILSHSFPQDNQLSHRRRVCGVGQVWCRQQPYPWLHPGEGHARVVGTQDRGQVFPTSQHHRPDRHGGCGGPWGKHPAQCLGTCGRGLCRLSSSVVRVSALPVIWSIWQLGQGEQWFCLP